MALLLGCRRHGFGACSEHLADRHTKLGPVHCVTVDMNIAVMHVRINYMVTMDCAHFSNLQGTLDCAVLAMGTHFGNRHFVAKLRHPA